MKIFTDIDSLRSAIFDIKKQGLRLSFVPTMGNLHAGHLSLVEKAKQCSDRTVVSIFVNPLQFGRGEDFSTYPRTLASDLEKLSLYHVDFIFTPNESVLYSNLNTHITRVHVLGLSDELCGVTRPHFFYGVTTILAKLFNIVQPDVAIFGQKDYQQLVIVQHMVEDLNFPIEILGMPIVREADGLAMSSRNQYLSQDERAQANKLYRTLCLLREQMMACKEKGNTKDIYQVWINEAMDSLNHCGFEMDYLSLRLAKNLALPELTHSTAYEQELILLAAAYLGKTRLLDNVKIKLCPSSF